MKILDLDEFLKLPSGTIYTKYAPCAFEDLCMKGETTGGDFFCVSLTAEVELGPGKFRDTTLLSAERLGCSVPMDFNSVGRDGFLNPDELFAVWDQEDINGLIDKLTESTKRIVNREGAEKIATAHNQGVEFGVLWLRENGFEEAAEALHENHEDYPG